MRTRLSISCLTNCQHSPIDDVVVDTNEGTTVEAEDTMTQQIAEIGAGLNREQVGGGRWKVGQTRSQGRRSKVQGPRSPLLFSTCRGNNPVQDDDSSDRIY